MANQSNMGDENPALTVWLLVLSMAYHQLYPQQLLQFLTWDYPIDVTLGANLTIVLFQLMVLLKALLQSNCNSNSDGKSKYTGMKILRLLLWLPGAVRRRYHQLYR
jgi:hypothetical protein